MQTLKKPMEIVIENRFILGRKLGSGSFGEVYMGTDKETGKEVAIKMEEKSCKCSVIKNEHLTYEAIYKPNKGIPKICWYGEEGDFRTIVMDLLGHNLEDLFCCCRRRFSLKTTLMIADQILNRIEYLHSCHFIHRDIKPENFVIGRGDNSSQVFMVDFGLSKRYRVDSKHIAYKDGNKLIGTARYASVNSHKGIQLSRRDDMESIGYLFVYFLKGRLPWQSIRCDNKAQKYQAIQRLKEEIPLNQLCSSLPKEFSLYLEHVRSLEFSEKPNYNYLRTIFRDLFHNRGFVYDQNFDFS